MTNIVSDNYFVNKICNESFLILEIYKFNAYPELRVGISTQDGHMHYLSLSLYLREGTNLASVLLLLMQNDSD